MLDADRIYHMLGLAARAGKVADGGFSTEKAVKSGKARLVIVTGDASPGTARKFADMCAFRHIRIVTFGTMDRLGHSIGKLERSVAAVLDEGFSRQLENMIRQQMQTEAGTWQD